MLCKSNLSNIYSKYLKLASKKYSIVNFNEFISNKNLNLSHISNVYKNKINNLTKYNLNNNPGKVHIYSRNFINHYGLFNYQKCYLCSSNYASSTRTYCTEASVASEITSLIGNMNEGVILDMTFGDGIHSQYLLDQFPNVKIIALDRDKECYKRAVELQQEKYQNRLLPIHGRISDLPDLLQKFDTKNQLLNSIDLIMIDPGVSQIQKSDLKRGFSYQHEAPLDFRMEKDGEVSGIELLKYIEQHDLTRILKYYGGERKARKIATALIENRYELQPMTTTTHLKNVVEKKLGRHYTTNCVFQGLRMFINNELNELNYGIILSEHYLKPGGKLIITSHNPVEDDLVCQHLVLKELKQEEDKFGDIKQGASSVETFSIDEVHNLTRKKWAPLTSGPVVPSQEKQQINPLLETVRIRAAEKI